MIIPLLLYAARKLYLRYPVCDLNLKPTTIYLLQTIQTHSLLTACVQFYHPSSTRMGHLFICVMQHNRISMHLY